MRWLKLRDECLQDETSFLFRESVVMPKSLFAAQKTLRAIAIGQLYPKVDVGKQQLIIEGCSDTGSELE